MTDERDIVERLKVKAEYTKTAFDNHSLGELYDEAAAEIVRLREELGRNRISTHGPDCHTYGPRHYACLVAHCEALRSEALEVVGPFARNVPDVYSDDLIFSCGPTTTSKKGWATAFRAGALRNAAKFLAKHGASDV